ncbi:GDSL esterase/lipase At1g28570-like [Lycium ferocissimum]|uniref:GDSL esterase/lipase At1g28570-like n=1 Tax=Lycium ferocissimum TaxID=112874 RepID=UPI002815038D|nr:GDSL esterase/lipase At1g28570-like [Lycium ferocissimum]
MALVCWSAFFFLVLLNPIEGRIGCFNSIISFGDSLTDTGNELHLTRNRNPPPYFATPPYGETFFHRPTGRFSDGRLIIDFIAESLALPLVPPYLGGKGKNFRQGVNFAVGGATALDSACLTNKGVRTTTNASLVIQLGWFKEMLSSHCKFPSECKEFLRKSLILVGEIGGNDFIYGFFGNNTKEEVESYVPAVINTISSAIQVAIIYKKKKTLWHGIEYTTCINFYPIHFAKLNFILRAFIFHSM